MSRPNDEISAVGAVRNPAFEKPQVRLMQKVQWDYGSIRTVKSKYCMPFVIMESGKDSCEIIIRDATIEDMVEVHQMIQELAAFEKLTDDGQLNAEDLVRDGFGPQASFRCKVADVGGRLTGYVLYYRTYSTCTGRGLMLEDLYVRQEFRSRGVGTRLFGVVAQEGLALGCKRLELHVLEWNPAKSFYEARGAQDLTAHWRHFRLGREQMRVAALATP